MKGCDARRIRNPHQYVMSLLYFLLILFSIIFSNWNAVAANKGDINGDGAVDVKDAILALQSISGMNPSGIRSEYTLSADVNKDEKIGFAETLYILQLVAGVRTVVFTYSPIDVSLLNQIGPLGNVNGRESHALPTDHMYFGAKTPSDPSTEIDIVAPGDMVITSLLLQTNKQASGRILEDYAVKGRVGSDMVFILGHISALTSELRAQAGSFEGYCNPSFVLDGNTYTQCSKNVQISVAAGEKIGVVAQQNNWTIDVFIYDQRVNLAFVNPGRSFGGMDTNENHAVCFIDYLSGPDADAMRQLLGENGIKRTVEPVCGEIMQDIAGTAQGRWYVSMEQYMALIHDNVDPSIGVISVGNGISTLPVGAYAFRPEPTGNVNADFSRVTADGTVYCYEPITSDIFWEYLYNFRDPNFVYAESGVHILVQMPSAEEVLIAGVSGSKCISAETMPSQATLFVR